MKILLNSKIQFSLFVLCFITATSGQHLKVTNHFIEAPAKDIDRCLWLKEAKEYRSDIRQQVRQTNGDKAWEIYNRSALAWTSRNFTCRMCMMYSLDFYNPFTNKYLIDSVIADGEKEFGGYNSIVLWHAYPRLGIDERNQFDFYRDMPGGLEGIRKLVHKCHKEDIRVFIDYNPWDTGTRREEKDDYEMLAEIVSAINADGVFLDTLSECSQKLRNVLDDVKPSLAIVSEGHPPFEQMSLCSGSWAQWLDEPEKPGILKLKWIEPGHIQYQIRRWDRCRYDEITTAFFNGSGMLIWENIFGTYNPWDIRDRVTWKKANLILQFFSDIFSKVNVEPYYKSASGNVYINLWQGKDVDIYILVDQSDKDDEKVLFEIPNEPDKRFYDLWHGRAIKPRLEANNAFIECATDRLGCVIADRKTKAGKDLQKLLQIMRKLSATDVVTVDSRNFERSVVLPDDVTRTPLRDRANPPAGMVFVPPAVKTFEIKHIRGECGCYPDSGKEQQDQGFGFGLEAGAVYPQVIHEPIIHTIGPVAVKPFFIDKTEVTNAQYKKFLEEAGYEPKHRKNFLKHWPGGKLPDELADHPVVYVDIDDARAYANWAGKRLPTELEWQLAAQGPGNRKWPWGDEFKPENCNTTGTRTLPVRSCPGGKSPYGCYHMSGNVWEWTESCRSDGHTRFVMIRGGSYFKAEGSNWYVKGGPQPCGHHAKFIRMWPGLDRCSTVGFRCVVDAK